MTNPHTDFLQPLHDLGQWLESYWNSLPARPVVSRMKPGQVAALLPDHPPDHGEGPDLWTHVLHDLDSIIVPGLTHWQHPRFFAYFPANISPPAILGELLSAGLGVQGMLWLTSPACTEVETRMLDWLREMLGLPPCFDSRPHINDGSRGGGVIHGTASEATLTALVAARDRARRLDKARGASSRPEFTVYASNQAHSSIVKAAMIAGIADGPDDNAHVRLIDVDDRYAIRTDLLEAALEHDLALGLVPCFVCANVGTTATTAIDPIDAVAETLDRVFAHRVGEGSPQSPARPWLHVDAAHAGSAAVCPEFRFMLQGLDRADSFCFNPHKWLLTNFDCDCFYVRDRQPLIDALSITPEYLRNHASDSGSVIDYRDWQIPLGRRFRALKLWFVIRAFGVAGLQEHIRRTVRLAQRFESHLLTDARFEIVAPRVLNLVCFRLHGPADASSRLLDMLQADHWTFLTPTTVPSRPRRANGPATTSILRVAVGAPATAEADIDALWDRCRTAADNVIGSRPCSP